MKKLLLMILITIPLYGQETPSKKKISLEFGTTVYGVNVAFAGFDIDGSIPFYHKNINSLWFKMTLMTFIPASISHPIAPYILFGGIWELQYRISTKKGFLFALETGLGVASEFMQAKIYNEEKGFYKDSAGMPYGIFSTGMRMGYDFEKKYKYPFSLNVFLGYRMQFPFNFTVKHLIMYGMGFSYRFDFGGK